jgi:glycosyltransferase involved in cell wall biosynthesis
LRGTRFAHESSAIQAAGIPTVATAVGGVPEIAGVDKAVSLVPPDNAEAITEAVSAILSDPMEKRQLAARGRSRVQQAYSLDRQRTQFHSLYRGLLSGERMETSPTGLSHAKVKGPQALGETTQESTQ